MVEMGVWREVLGWVEKMDAGGPGATCYASNCLWHNGSRCTRYRSCADQMQSAVARVDQCWVPLEELRGLLEVIEEDRTNFWAWGNFYAFCEDHCTGIYEVAVRWAIKRMHDSWWDKSPCKGCPGLEEVRFREWFPGPAISCHEPENSDHGYTGLARREGEECSFAPHEVYCPTTGKSRWV